MPWTSQSIMASSWLSPRYQNSAGQSPAVSEMVGRPVSGFDEKPGAHEIDMGLIGHFEPGLHEITRIRASETAQPPGAIGRGSVITMENINPFTLRWFYRAELPDNVACDPVEPAAS